MKKVLLTTTALVMTAGVASAEITFSGTGEAGVYRTAPTAAVAAVAGVKVTQGTAVTATTDGDASHTADDGTATIGYVAGVLTTTAMSDPANPDSIAANAAAVTAAPTAGSVAAQEIAVIQAREAVIEAEAAIGTATEADHIDEEIDAIAVAQAKLAQAEAVLAAMKGSAAVAKGKASDLSAYSGYDFDVAASGSSDNGMTFAMGFDMGAGMIADQDDDRAMDAQAGAIATSAMTIGYAGYTVEIGDDKIDDLYDDTQNGDVSIAGSFGDLTFKLVTDMDDDVKAVSAASVFTKASGTLGEDAGDDAYVNATFTQRAAVAAVYNPTSYSVGYSMGNVAFSMAGTEHDDRGHAAAKMSLTYTVSDALSATLSSDNVGTYKDIGKVSVTSKISDALSITASVKDDKDHALNTNTGGKQSQDVSISYTAGALSSTLATDEGSNWWVNAKYDLGGGATAFTTFDHTEFLVAGVNFAF